MAKLYLKFADKVLKEIVLSQGVVTIGRLPDNLVHLDNPGVSAHHARIYWENDHYVVEDLNSTNGTSLNGQPAVKAELKDADVVLVGKHSLEFRDRFEGETTGARKVVDRTRHWQKRLDETAPAKLDPTALMDMERAKEMMAAGGRTSAAAKPATSTEVKVGILKVIAEKADAQQYRLVGKMTIIGKSAMATIRLKGWFAPEAAAVINKQDEAYLIAPSGKDVVVLVNDIQISGPQQLKEGDVLEFAGLKMTFGYL